MKVREAMTRNPVCCTPTETADKVARMMCEHNVGSIPVVTDGQSRRLAGIITTATCAAQLWRRVWTRNGRQ